MDEAGHLMGGTCVIRIRPKASRDRPWDVVWLHFAAPHNCLVVYVTITSARTNSNVLAVGAPLAVLRWGLNKLSLMLISALRPPVYASHSI
jgi:hypothetical protein